MISLENTREYVPQGRRVIQHLPAQSLSASNIDGVGYTDDEAEERWWVGPGPSEEIYSRGNTVIWTQGAHTKKCLTCLSRVVEVVRCTFFTSPDRPCIINTSVSQEPKGDPIPTICIRHSNSLRIYSDAGEDWQVALQFGVLRSWQTKFGLLLERQVLEKDKPRTPVIFSLLHPLDDLTRVILKHNNKVGELTDQTQQIVYTDVESSIAITYNSQTDLHSVWRIRRANQEETESARYLPEHGGGGIDTPLPSGASSAPLNYTPLNSGQNSASLAFTPSGQRQGGNSPACTPIGARLSRNPSGGLNTPVSSHPGSPGHVTRPCSPATRLNSPQSMNMHKRVGVSPSFSSKVTARLGESPCRLSKLNATTLKDEDENPLPLEVTLCFDHIWSEQLHSQRKLSGKAKKVFMTEDAVGQTYFAFLLPATNQLNLVKYKLANDDGTTMIFGATEKISALDAVWLEELRMVLVLEPGGGLVLYSGTVRVGRVLLPPSTTTLLSQEISALALDSKPGTPFLGMDYVSTPIQPERKPNVLPAFHATVEKGDGKSKDFTFLSPVSTADLSNATLVGLRDGRDREVTFAYSTGHLVRVTLPAVATSLVTKALNTVEQLLPLELALQLYGAWYSKRHAPGPVPNPAAEWDMFCKCILGMSGYQVDQLDLSTSSDIGGCPGPKKSKTEIGTDGDWQYLLESPQHTHSGHSISKILKLDHVVKEATDSRKPDHQTKSVGHVNPASPLFSYIPALFWSLHLLYEELKLDTSLYGDLQYIANLLSRLAVDMKLASYLHHYWKDFPENSSPLSLHRESQLTPDLLARLNVSGMISADPPCIYSHLTSIHLRQGHVSPFPILASVNPVIRLITSCYAALANTQGSSVVNLENYLKLLAQPGRPVPPLPPLVVRDQLRVHVVAQLLAGSNWDRMSVNSLPPSIAATIFSTLSACRRSPDPRWSRAVLRLVGREDLAAMQNMDNDLSYRCTEEAADGLEGLDSSITKLRWPKDLRVVEARRVLQSCKPVVVSVEQGPEVSDHDFVEEQEYFLKRVCERTMALPIGRGIAALRTTTPLPTEILSIPQLCLTGKAPPRGTKVDLSHIDYSQTMDHWPSFHNGVAAGLRLCADPGSQEVNSTWISFNRPLNSSETNAETEHAGFLMALGLNGHLSKLSKLDAFEYLNKGSEPISIGLLLGVGASFFGTMDVLVTKKLATQLEALLPPTATELPLSHNTQVAALMGVGLLYANTGHRHMVEVCMKELGKPPAQELENCVDRESYSLIAGFSLGLITMGEGESLVKGGLADLNLPDVLHNHMLGGPRPKPNSTARERPQSYQIKEGDNINIDITSPGATLALGMMYWNSNNKSIASWMAAPETIFLLDFVRPDFLMFRTLAKGLILWESIEPSVGWIESHVPASMLPHCLVRPPDEPAPGLENLDYETLNQAYCNIVSGAAFALALRFAGTWNAAAFDTLEALANKFIAISKRSIAELTGKAVIEQTLCIIVLAQGIVMAGSGDLSVLRVVRYLRSRVHTSTIVTYGSHMAVHMAVGLLFLGGGKFGLASTPSAVAAMIIAFFPKFPTHSNDNRYHLQALRHLYVLAVEPRLVLPRCTDTGDIVSCSLSMQYADTPWYKGPRLSVLGPILVPSLSLLSSLSVDDKQYWRTVFTNKDDWQGLKRILEHGGNLMIKKCGLSATGFQGFQWSIGEEERNQLKELKLATNFINLFLKGSPGGWRTEMESVLLNCVAKEHQDLVPVLASLLALPSQLSLQRVGLVSQQLRTLLSGRHLQTNSENDSPDLDAELLHSLHQRVLLQLDASVTGTELRAALASYIVGQPLAALHQGNRQLLASVLSFNHIPAPPSRPLSSLPSNPLKIFQVMKESPNPASLHRIIHACSS